jgi:hypothetical protein
MPGQARAEEMRLRFVIRKEFRPQEGEESSGS